MFEKGLYPLPLPIKVFIISYLVLVGAGLLVAFWVVLESPIIKGESINDQYSQEELQVMKSALFYENLKKAHVHHLGHIFMVFSITGLYAFTREKNNIKIQVIVWTTIITLIHTLAFLLYSKILLIVFGSAYAVIIAYMMLKIFIDCLKHAET